jgi:hypothetical protein
MAHGPFLEGRASAARQKSVFLNLPYDARFRSLFLAYVAGTSAFGLIPRATLEIPGSARRLDRILALMESCQVFHSRYVQGSTGPATAANPTLQHAL